MLSFLKRAMYKDAEALQRALNEVVYSSRAISDVAHLKGRDREIDLLMRALLTPGRQPFIYGLRGAGKTSLALSVARKYSQTTDTLIVCAPQMTFSDIIRNLAAKALSRDPFETDRSVQTKVGGTATIGIVKGEVSDLETKSFKGIPAANDPNEALAILSRIAQIKKKRFCFIIDEFDQLADTSAHLQLGILAKLIADEGAPVQFIFCGVADDVQQIFKAHPSTLRLFEPIEANRLALQACFDIMQDINDGLGVSLERDTQFRIAQISDGFPYFIHLICEKIMWRWFADPNRGDVTAPKHYEDGLLDASTSAAPELRDPYEMAASKYALDGELLVWALASGDLLEKQIKAIARDFTDVFDTMRSTSKPSRCLNQNQISARLALFMGPAYGRMVMRPRRSYYAFAEKRMRGYARLRAELRGLTLRPDHPMIPRIDR